MDGIEIAFKPCTMHHALLLRLSLSLSLTRSCDPDTQDVCNNNVYACMLNLPFWRAKRQAHTSIHSFIYLFSQRQNTKTNRLWWQLNNIIRKYTSHVIGSTLVRPCGLTSSTICTWVCTDSLVFVHIHIDRFRCTYRPPVPPPSTFLPFSASWKACQFWTVLSQTHTHIKSALMWLEINLISSNITAISVVSTCRHLYTLRASINKT